MHNVSAWVWGAGGHYLSDDGKSALFDRPEAIKGFQQYFSLGHYLSPDYQNLDDTQSDALYSQGQAVVTISGPWLLVNPGIQNVVVENTGIAFPPGTPFVGGSCLIIWQASRRVREALALVKYLTSEQVQRSFLYGAGLLPVRLDVLSKPPFSDDPRYRFLADGLQKGRSFRLLPLWGLVEDRLSNAMTSFWMKFLNNPELDIRENLEKDLKVLANQINLILSNE